MGRGDNRRTVKVRRRKGWRQKKARLARRIEEGKAGKSAGGARAAAPASGSATIRRPGD